jgi:hypothetical protein
MAIIENYEILVNFEKNLIYSYCTDSNLSVQYEVEVTYNSLEGTYSNENN